MALNYVHADKLLDAMESIAFQADCSGTAYAHQAAIIRQGIAKIIELAATIEELRRAETDRLCVVPPAAPQLDSDGVPVHGRPCTNCED